MRFAPGRRRRAADPALALFHPLDDHYGLRPLEAAAAAVDIHNAAGALEQGAARQRGAALGRAGLSGREGGGNSSDEQFERLKRELEATFPARRMPGGRCCWKAGSTGRRWRLSPKDMDFIEAKHGAAREIALAFGVPPMLLGIPGDNTYANYARPTARSGGRRCCRWSTRIGEGDLGDGSAPAWGEGVCGFALDLDAGRGA